MRYAVVKVAGLNKGKIKSIHRYFNSAMKACPPTYHTVKQVANSFRKGDYVL